MRITIEYIGGPLDGERFSASSAEASASCETTESALVVMAYHQSSAGTVGKQFVVPPLDESPDKSSFDIGAKHRTSHVYEIAERTEGGGELHLLARFVRSLY